VAYLFGGFWSTTWKTRQKNTPIDWEVGEGGHYAFGLAWLIFTTAYSFLMISPNLLNIWPVFFLILSPYETAHFLIVFRTSGDGYSLLGIKKWPLRHRAQALDIQLQGFPTNQTSMGC
jgi:hypothetical protein